MSFQLEPILKSMDTYRQYLDAIPDPVKKFNAFNDITDTALNTAAFRVLKTIAQDSNIAELRTSREFSLGSLGPQYIADVQRMIDGCKMLSNEKIRPLSHRAELSSLCSNPDTYIDSKMYQLLAKIVPQFGQSHQQNHPLNPLHTKMWELQEYNHGSTCPCHARIQAFVNQPPL